MFAGNQKFPDKALCCEHLKGRAVREVAEWEGWNNLVTELKEAV